MCDSTEDYRDIRQFCDQYALQQAKTMKADLQSELGVAEASRIIEQAKLQYMYASYVRKRRGKDMSMNWFQYIELPDGTLKITEYLSSPGYEEIEIPAFLHGRKVSTIGKRVLANRGGAPYGVVVANGITTIEDEAFGDPQIADIYLPNSICRVTGNPFHIPMSGMVMERKVHFSANHPYLIINDNVLFGKSDKRVICYFSHGRSEYTVPFGIKTIGKHAIINNNLLKVFLPDSVDRIEESGIQGEYIIEIRLPRGLKYIGKRAFPSNAVNGSYTIPKTVEVIEGAAFFNMFVSLETEECNFYIKNKILIEKSTETALCFSEPNITRLLIPDSVRAIGDSAFSKTQITTAKIPETVQTIEDEAFYEASNLEKIDLPMHLRKIGVSAFEGCKKLRLKIPSSVIDIGDFAFGRTRYDLINLLIVEPGSFAEAYANKWRLEYSTESSAIDPMGWLNEDLNNETSTYTDEETEYEDEDKEEDIAEEITIQRGDLVEFGSYYFLKDDKEMIILDWNVIKEDSDTFWLLSKNLIEVMPYNTYNRPRDDMEPIMDHNGKYAYVWHNSSLREWLNNEFYEMAFDDDEKEVLIKQKLTFPSYREEYYEEEFNLHGYSESDQFPDTEDYVTIPPIEYEESDNELFLNKDAGLPSPYAYEKMKTISKSQAMHYQIYQWSRKQLMDTTLNKAYRDYSSVPAELDGFVRIVVRVAKKKLYDLLNSYNSEYLNDYKNRFFKEREANKEQKEKVLENRTKQQQNKKL